jgi:hypothetical protein
MTREQFLSAQAHQLDCVFSFTNGEDESRNRFEQMALDTYELLSSLSVTQATHFSVRPGGTPIFLLQKCGEKLPRSLLCRWESWGKEYDEIVRRNPRLELRDMMHDISESYMSASWPVGYEDVIQDWVDAGDPAASAFFVVPETGTAEFYHRLREVRQLCGGWLYWDGDNVVFAPEPEWQKIRAQKKAREAEERKRQTAKYSADTVMKFAVGDPTIRTIVVRTKPTKRS